MVELRKEFIEKMKNNLLKERERLQKELSAIEEDMHRKQSDESGENDYEDDMADVGTSTLNREIDDSLAWNIKDLLYQVNKALDSIEEGDYGKCGECPEGIPKKRLEALPWASTCLGCQVKKEG